MALTEAQAAAVRLGQTYEYRYVLSIRPHGPDARFKGQIQPYRSERAGDVNYDFRAPNDETAYAHLLATFGAGDLRHLQSCRLVTSARKETVEVRE